MWGVARHRDTEQVHRTATTDYTRHGAEGRRVSFSSGFLRFSWFFSFARLSGFLLVFFWFSSGFLEFKTPGDLKETLGLRKT